MWLPLLLSRGGLGPLPYSGILGIIATGGIGTFSDSALAAFVMLGATLQAIVA